MPVDKLTHIRPTSNVLCAVPQLWAHQRQRDGRRVNCCYKPAHTNMGTKVPGYERSQERKFPGTFVLQERKFPRTKGPGVFVCIPTALHLTISAAQKRYKSVL